MLYVSLLTVPPSQSRCWVKDGYLYVPGVICGHECALCVCHFFPSGLNSHVCQHTHKALSLTPFFFFWSIGSKHTCWLAAAGLSYMRRSSVAGPGSRIVGRESHVDKGREKDSFPCILLTVTRVQC